MATLHEKVGMRIGLTLTNSTNPSLPQVTEFLQDGLARVQVLLDPSDIWPLTVTYTGNYDLNGITMSELSKDKPNVNGYAQIISILADGKRATEVPPGDWHKSKLEGSMYNGDAEHPVFTTKNGTIIISPATATTEVEIEYIGTIEIDPDLSQIPNVPMAVESAVINYATAQAALMLAAYYAQEEDPISQSMNSLAAHYTTLYDNGMQVLLRKSKIRGNIS